MKLGNQKITKTNTNFLNEFFYLKKSQEFFIEFYLYVWGSVRGSEARVILFLWVSWYYNELI